MSLTQIRNTRIRIRICIRFLTYHYGAFDNFIEIKVDTLSSSNSRTFNGYA